MPLKFHMPIAASIAFGFCGILILARVLPANFDAFTKEHSRILITPATDIFIEDPDPPSLPQPPTTPARPAESTSKIIASALPPSATEHQYGDRPPLVSTTLSITYRDLIRSGEPAVVEVSFSQTEETRSNYHFRVLTALPWPVTLTLSVDNKADTKRKEMGAQLPTKLVWASSVNQGYSKIVAILSVTHILEGNPKLLALNGKVRMAAAGKVSVNGKTSAQTSNDDIQLPILIYRYGMPVWLWDNLSLGGTIISFILGCAFLTDIISRIWTRISGRSGDQHYT